MDTYYVFLDVDGTLVTYENELPESAVTAIKQAQENGHKVYTVTGRSKAEMYTDILAVGFDGYIGGNGSYIESNDKVVSERTLSSEDCRKIVDWLHMKGLEFYLESNDGLFGSVHFEDKAVDTIQVYAARKGNTNAPALKVKDVFPNMIFTEDLYRDKVNKVSFLLDDYSDYLEAKEFFPEFKVGSWGGMGETALFGDIALSNIDKSTALHLLLDHLNALDQKTIAFGDAKVDIPMLEYCQTGVAMGNGGKEIKAMADYITHDVAEDGLHHAFKHFGLI
ncbi:MAG: HAD family hydrolase [Alkalibacterium sp.]|nr:HAD family hydrolase [Alkalibacterium sp.]